MKELQGVKRKPTTEAEAEAICLMFGLPKIRLKKLKESYIFTDKIKEIKETREGKRLADEYDKNNESESII